MLFCSCFLNVAHSAGLREWGLVVGGRSFQAPSACRWHWNTGHGCTIEGNRKSRDRTAKCLLPLRLQLCAKYFAVSFFSILVTQKYAVKQQAFGLFSQRDSTVSASAWTRLLKEPCLGLCRLHVSAFCFSRTPHCTDVRSHTSCVSLLWPSHVLLSLKLHLLHLQHNIFVYLLLCDRFVTCQTLKILQ